jgi:ribosomal protein L3
VEEFEGHEELRRNGTLGVKLGMTIMYDKWGNIVPVSIILLDRVQVVQIKNP